MFPLQVAHVRGTWTIDRYSQEPKASLQASLLLEDQEGSGLPVRRWKDNTGRIFTLKHHIQCMLVWCISSTPCQCMFLGRKLPNTIPRLFITWHLQYSYLYRCIQWGTRNLGSLVHVDSLLISIVVWALGIACGPLYMRYCRQLLVCV